MLPRQIVAGTDRSKSDKLDKPRRRIPEVVFCKEYQRNQCRYQGSHPGKYKDEPGQVTLEHCCAKCWLRNKAKLAHPEASEACPQCPEMA